MPLYKSLDVNSQTHVKIWHISEPLDALKASLNLKKESLERVNSMKSELHQRGFLCVRKLLKTFGYTDQDLFYDNSGKPHLKDGHFISITHSYNYAAVVVSGRPVGIDIEKQRHKILNIASRFIGYESHYLNENSDKYIQKLTWIWCIKESLYKLYSKSGISFKKNFLVLPFGSEKNTTKVWILEGGRRLNYESLFFEFDGFACAITTTEA
jgi:phosphopantetheinyl transferase